MEDRNTDPGIIKLKLKEEIKNLREARRADRIEFVEQSQRQNREFNDLARRHNDLVAKADDAIKLAATLGSCLAGLAAFSILLIVTAWLEGTIPLRAGVMSCIVAGCVGFVVHTLVDKALWVDEEAE